MRMGTFTDLLLVRASMIIGNGTTQLGKVLRSQKKIDTTKYLVNSNLKKKWNYFSHNTRNEFELVH